MKLGTVIGRVTLSRSVEALKGGRFLVVSPFSREQYAAGLAAKPGMGKDPSLVVYDNLGANVRQIIGYEEGREAAQACRAVYAHLGLADFTDEQVELAVDAAGSKDLGETDTLAVLGAAHAIRQRRLTVLDIVAALDECGYCHEAERAVAFVRTRLSGDYLQTSAIFDEHLGVLSLVTDPNDYAGPGTGYQPSPGR